MNYNKNSLVNIGNQIKKFRKISNLTVKETISLMYHYGILVSEKVFYKWESNDITPNLTSIIVLSDIFNITTSTFLQNPSCKKQNITRQEMDFIIMFRTNKYFKKIVFLLYKEGNNNVKNWT